MTGLTTQLIQKTYSGDAKAKNDLCEHVYDRVIKIVRGARKKYPGLWNKAETLEIFSEVWRKAVENQIHKKQFPDAQAFQNYLAVAARNILIDELRRLQQVRAPCEKEDQEAYERNIDEFEDTEAEGVDDHLRLYELLESMKSVLTTDENNVYWMHVVMGVSKVELAQIYNVSEATMRRQISAIGEKLKHHFVTKGV
jgi:RNA polymerase sigma factor (sigma-70 family)